MDGPWVVKRPPPWLRGGDIRYAMAHLEYYAYGVNFVDERQPNARYHNRLVVLPEYITVNPECIRGRPAGSVPRDMKFFKISTDGVFAYYWDPHFGSFNKTNPHARYRIESLPAPPSDVMDIAIIFAQGRRRFDAILTPPPPPWREALNRLAALRGYFPS